MIPLSLGEIATVTRGRVHPATARQVLVRTAVVTDSREAEPGSLYVARRGEHADGHEFVGAAAAGGAVAALSARPVPELPCIVVQDVQAGFAALAREVVDRCQRHGGLDIMGITGSSGKTSTKDLAAQVIAQLGPTVAPIASYNSEVGVPLTVCRLQESTAYLVAEMGASGPGHIDYLTKIAPPRIGVVLNVGSAHLGEFGSREAIAHAKAELVRALQADGLAVLNADDPVVAGMKADSAAPVVLVGRHPAADVRADHVRLDPKGRPSFTLTARPGWGTTGQGRSGQGLESAEVVLRTSGEHQVGNALAVAAVALELGMPLGQVADALGAAGALSRWRMEVHERPDGVTVVNDAYNANPESVAAALRSLAAMRGQGRSVAVIGEMLELGEQSAGEHEAVGRLAAELGIDVFLSVGPGAVASSAAFGAGSGQTHSVADIDEAEQVLDELLRPGDVVLVKSSNGSGLGVLGERLAADTAKAGSTW